MKIILIAKQMMNYNQIVVYLTQKKGEKPEVAAHIFILSVEDLIDEHEIGSLRI